MGFLDSLWDEIVAGPAPDTKLRKHNSLSVAQMQQQLSPPNDVPPPVSRRITILRHNSVSRNLSIEPPESPTWSDSPVSPFSPLTPPLREDYKKPTRKRKEAYEKTEHNGYDWIVLSSLDR